MSTIVASIVTMSILLVIYHHVIYPVLLRLCARWCRVPFRDVPVRGYRDHNSDLALPRIAIVIPAFNESEVIADKVRDLALLDYPAERLQVFIVCDGCTDDTAARANAAANEPECRHLRVTVWKFAVNRGKLAILNDVLPSIDADLIALTDASALVSVDALLIAADHFADPQVGVVCGTYRLLKPNEGEDTYWKYQVKVKKLEADIGALLGAHGAFYMFRRSLFWPLPSDTINDDFVLPMTIVRLGYQAIYDVRISAVEIEQSTSTQDYWRRRRIAAGNIQQLLRLRQLLHPRYKGTAFAFASGKALRTILPFLMVLSFGGSLALAFWSPWFAAAAAGQGLGYGLALLRHLMPSRGWPRPIEVIYYAVSGHIAGLVGTSRYLLGLEEHGWFGDRRLVRPPRLITSEGSFAGAPGRQDAGESRQAAPFPEINAPPVRPLPDRTQARKSRRQRGSHVHPVVATAKRAVDLILASVLLIITAPLFLLITVAIRLDSRGPVFFQQLRIGESRPDYTRLFQIIKFRTMKKDAEATTGAVWASEDDPRITRVGHFLRRTRLDELPQLVNVLRGEMSLIGPRPERLHIFRHLDAIIPFYGERMYSVKPGITGYAQVSQGYDRTIDDVRAKLLYDHAYAVALSRPSTWLALDLRIMVQTPFVIVFGLVLSGGERGLNAWTSGRWLVVPNDPKMNRLGGARGARDRCRHPRWWWLRS